LSLLAAGFIRKEMSTGPQFSHPRFAASVPATLEHVRSLADFSTRRQTQTYWIEGIRQFVQAHDGRHDFEAIVYSPVLLQAPLADMLIRRLGAAGVPRVRVTPEQFRSISITERASGVGAIVRERWTGLERADPARGTCHLVIDFIRSPGNLGTLLRTAEAAGVGNVFFVSPACDPFDPGVVRASMGGLFHLPLVRTTAPLLGAWARKNRVKLVGLSPQAELLWTELPATPRTALILGEERKGLSAPLRALAHTSVRLPMTGRADSLNVATAGAIMMYEMLRRDPLLSRAPRAAASPA
jgi:TrmH family RNA methyltransferase